MNCKKEKVYFEKSPKIFTLNHCHSTRIFNENTTTYSGLRTLSWCASSLRVLPFTKKLETSFSQGKSYSL